MADQQGDGGRVMSKVAYDDGDVEVLDLFAASAKVRLIAHASGAPASDADEPPGRRLRGGARGRGARGSRGAPRDGAIAPA